MAKLEGLKFGDLVRNKILDDNDEFKTGIVIHPPVSDNIRCTNKTRIFSYSNHRDSHIEKVGSIFDGQDALLEACKLNVIYMEGFLKLFDRIGRNTNIKKKLIEELMDAVNMVNKAIALTESERTQQ